MFLVGSLVSGLIAVGCLVGGIRAINTQREKRRHGVYASGTVVGLEKRILQPGSSGVYCPVVEFTDAAGEKHRFESAFGTMPASHRVGDTVRMFYNPDRPDEAEIESSISRFFVPGCLLVFAIGAGAFSLIFLGLFFLYRR